MDTLSSRLKSLKTLAGASGSFDTARAPNTPQALFIEWLDAVLTAGAQEPQVMTLSTVRGDGSPDARSVVLLNVDELGWQFAASAASPKGRQLAERPQAALTFYWPALAMQIRLRGTIERLPDDIGTADFFSRPERSRAAILAGHQSEPLNDPADLQNAIQAQLARISAQPQLASPHWSLYALAPQEAEFWRSDADRRFTRLLYRRSGQQWERCLLWP